MIFDEDECKAELTFDPYTFEELERQDELGLLTDLKPLDLKSDQCTPAVSIKLIEPEYDNAFSKEVDAEPLAAFDLPEPVCEKFVRTDEHTSEDASTFMANFFG